MQWEMMPHAYGIVRIQQAVIAGVIEVVHEVEPNVGTPVATMRKKDEARRYIALAVISATQDLLVFSNKSSLWSDRTVGVAEVAAHSIECCEGPKRFEPPSPLVDSDRWTRQWHTL
jgi:hypothetical protein